MMGIYDGIFTNETDGEEEEKGKKASKESVVCGGCGMNFSAIFDEASCPSCGEVVEVG